MPQDRSYEALKQLANEEIQAELRRRKKLTRADTDAIVRDVAMAMAAAHASTIYREICMDWEVDPAEERRNDHH